MGSSVQNAGSAQKWTGALAEKGEASNNLPVKIDDDLKKQVLSALERRIADNPESWRGLSQTALNEVACVCVELMRGAINAQIEADTVIDPVSGLTLPPRPDIFYADRASKYGRKITPEEFIQNEVWGKYRDAGLLYSKHILHVDPRLYDAIHAKAVYNRYRPAEYMALLGIITRNEVENPPPGYERQVRLLRASDAQQKMNLNLGKER